MSGLEQDSQIIQIRTSLGSAPAEQPGSNAAWHVIGEVRRREGLSLEQVASRARVSPLVVEAIETGAIERLPVGNGGRRETIAVCRTLGLDPKPFLEDLRRRRPAIAGQLDTPKTVGRRARFLIIGLVWILLGAVLVLGRTLGWVDSGNEVTPTTTTVESTTTVATTAPPNPNVAFTVDVQAARGGTPLTATVDGNVIYDRILARGQEVRFEGNQIQLGIIQPTVVRVFVNGTQVASEATMLLTPPPPPPPPPESTAPPPEG